MVNKQTKWPTVWVLGIVGTAMKNGVSIRATPKLGQIFLLIQAMRPSCVTHGKKELLIKCFPRPQLSWAGILSFARLDTR